MPRLLAGSLALLAALGCRSAPPAVAPPPDPVARGIARFQKAYEELYAAYRPRLEQAEMQGTQPPGFDPNALLEECFPALADAADAGDARAREWCLCQARWFAPSVEQAFGTGRFARWWSAYRDSRPSDESLKRVLRFLPSTPYPFELAEEACAAFEAQAQSLQTKAFVLDTRATLMECRGASFEERRPLLERLIAEYPETHEARRARGALQQASVLRVGQPFPRWAERRLIDIERALQSPDFDPAAVQSVPGATFRLSEFRGQVVALVFWDYHCGFCLLELPEEREMIARLAPRGAAIVGVYTDPDLACYREFRDKIPAPWRNAWDVPGPGRGGPLMKELGATGVPFTVVLDREGIVRAIGPRGKALEQALGSVLASGPGR